MKKSNCCHTGYKCTQNPNGTNYYYCLKCHKPCDLIKKDKRIKKIGLSSVFICGLEEFIADNSNTCIGKEIHKLCVKFVKELEECDGEYNNT